VRNGELKMENLKWGEEGRDIYRVDKVKLRNR